MESLKSPWELQAESEAAAAAKAAAKAAAQAKADNKVKAKARADARAKAKALALAETEAEIEAEIEARAQALAQARSDRGVDTNRRSRGGGISRHAPRYVDDAPPVQKRQAGAEEPSRLTPFLAKKPRTAPLAPTVAFSIPETEDTGDPDATSQWEDVEM